MRQVRVWSVASIVGLVAGTVAWTVFDIMGHDPMMASGLGAGAGVSVAALAGRWIEKRHQARELLARFLESNQQ